MTISRTAGANRLPTTTWPTQNRPAAISPTLAARPSMLSSMLNELVRPTIHITVTSATEQRMSERPEQGHADARGGQNRCAEDLDPQPELPLQVLPVVDQAHDHDDRGQGQDLQQLAGPAEKPAGGDMLGHRPGKLGAAQQNGQTAGSQHDHGRQPDGHTPTQRHGRLVALVPARPVQKAEPQRDTARASAQKSQDSTNAATASPSPASTRTQSYRSTSSSLLAATSEPDHLGFGRYQRRMLTQATNRIRNSASTRPMVIHSIGRSGGQPALSPPADDGDDDERPAERDDRHRGQQDIRKPGQGVGGLHEVAAPDRAAIRSRQ